MNDPGSNLLMLPDELCALLEGVGYVWDGAEKLWTHPQLKRSLDGAVALSLSVDQVTTWINARTAG